MSLTLRFYKSLLTWSGVLVLLALVADTVSGGGFEVALGRSPRWFGGVLPLGAFAGAITVGRDVLREQSALLRPLGNVIAMVLAVCVLTFLWVGWIAPIFASPASSPAGVEPETLSFGELYSWLGENQPPEEGADLAAWMAWNRGAFDLVHRMVVAFEVILLAWLGLLTEFWSRWSENRDVRRLQYWAMAIFLFLSRYLVFENSYEQMVLTASEPVQGIALATLVVPGLLTLGLSWSTAVVLWKRPR